MAIVNNIPTNPGWWTHNLYHVRAQLPNEIGKRDL